MTTGKISSVLAGCVLAVGLMAAPYTQAQVSVSITLAPPALPIYVQPAVPAPGYIWTPGYWSYGPDGYFWVPGTWVEPPAVGLLWTPGYWGWSSGLFVWNAGYWGPQIGFYGGVNYGFGYPGHGYEGGYWRANQFYYNRTVNNITNVQIHNVYTKTVVNNVTVNHISYVGGPGGITARPTAQEEQAAHERHTPPTDLQIKHRESASSQRELLATVNQGKPQIAATAKPNDFTGHVVNASRAGGPVPVVHARDLPKSESLPAPSASASAEEKEYARQQTQLQAKQTQERETLAQQQDRDHATLKQQGNNAQALANMEQQHQQQTQQLQVRHASEQQSVPRPAAPHTAQSHEGPH
jgi:hypothetical protein